MGDITIMGISAVTFTIAFVEGIKSMASKIDGRLSQALTLLIGLIMGGLAYVLREGALPSEVFGYIYMVLTGFVVALTAMGVFELGRRNGVVGARIRR